MNTYLNTPQDLAANAIAELGNMAEGSYSHFVVAAATAAAGKTTRPKLGIAIRFKPEVGQHDQAYPISADEWDVFLNDARTMCTEIPKVFVVDGNRFSMPI